MVKSLSIIIVTYNSQSLINNCLSSIQNNLDINRDQIEVVVVDNSPAKSALEIENLVMSHTLNETVSLKYIHNTANLGYGQGNNIGIGNSTGNILCIMNPDVNFIEPVFQRVISHFSANPNLALLGGKQLGYRDLSFYVMPEKKLSIFQSLLLVVFNKLNLFHKRCMFLSGALLFIDKKKFNEIGNFDENIFMYNEEADITTRFIKSNYDIIYDSRLRYRHLIEGREKWSHVSRERAFESLQYYCNKYNYNIQNIINKNIISLKVNRIWLKIFGNKDQLKVNLEQLKYYCSKKNNLQSQK